MSKNHFRVYFFEAIMGVGGAFIEQSVWQSETATQLAVVGD